MFKETQKIKYNHLIYSVIVFVFIKFTLNILNEKNIWFYSILLSIYIVYLLFLISCKFQIEINHAEIIWHTQYAFIKKRILHFNDIQKIEICMFSEGWKGIYANWSFKNWDYNFGGDSNVKFVLNNGIKYMISVQNIEDFIQTIEHLQKTYHFQFEDLRITKIAEKLKS